MTKDYRTGIHLPSITMRDVRIHAISERECINFILTSLEKGIGGCVVTPNLDILRRCERDAVFRGLIAHADLVVADGMPLIWASHLQGTPLPERIAGSTLVRTLSGAAAEAGRSVFLLGGAPGSADGASAVLHEEFPRLRITGIHVPPFGFDREPVQTALIRSRIAESNPDIIFVGLGSPKQELLIERIRSAAPRAWWLGVGVSFSFLAGDVRRAPLWVQRVGLEWMHRLAQQPRRLARRYLVHGLPYAFRLLGVSMLKGVSARARLVLR